MPLLIHSLLTYSLKKRDLIILPVQPLTFWYTFIPAFPDDPLQLIHFNSPSAFRLYFSTTWIWEKCWKFIWSMFIVPVRLLL